MRARVIFGGLLLVIVVLVGLVVGKERVLARGTPVLLELAPVDPRSLMQGDYMVLDYAVSREAGLDRLSGLPEDPLVVPPDAPDGSESASDGSEPASDGSQPARNAAARKAWDPDVKEGRLVLRLDAQGVGHFVRHEQPGVPLGPGELLLRFKFRSHRVRLGAESFFFQEGHADRYDRAKYGELRVTADGSSVLVGLRDAERRSLGGPH